MSNAHVYPTRIGLPQGVDLYKWSVIAADQFSSSTTYWNRVEEIVGDAPSTLHMVVPEVYLTLDSSSQMQQRVENTHAAMRDYCERVLAFEDDCVIYVQRQTPHVNCRNSLVVALDLDTYSYDPNEAADVRASEATVLERIPAREAVRQEAVLELPHVQVLYDDPSDHIQQLIEDGLEGLDQLYDAPLMMGGGRVRGWKIAGDSSLWVAVKAHLDGLVSRHGFRFIVGDGNHSLAAAKSHWQKVAAHIRSSTAEEDVDSALAEHPARYALVELLNVHDAGLTMEPIHRWLRGISIDQLLQAVSAWNDAHDGQLVELDMFSAEGSGTLEVKQSGALVIEAVQDIIDALISELELESSHACEYIHGVGELQRLVAEDGGIGIALPALDRSALFDYVATKGAMPRKSFSLGEAEEKRYYLETRAITTNHC